MVGEWGRVWGVGGGVEHPEGLEGGGAYICTYATMDSHMGKEGSRHLGV